MLFFLPNADPLFELVSDLFDIRVLIECEGAKPIARRTVVVKDDGVVPISRIAPD